MAELRSAIFIDQLQPQTMCYLGTWVRGRLPRSGMAAAVIEVAPGLMPRQLDAQGQCDVLIIGSVGVNPAVCIWNASAIRPVA